MKFRIAVCDDEAVVCETLYAQLQDIAKSRSVTFEIDCFTAGEALCREMEAVDYDLVFLDIALPQQSGVAVGRYIRQTLKNETVQIAYISSKQEYAMELFEMRPLHFLLKPLTKERVERLVDKFLRLNAIDTNLFRFKVGQEYYQIPLSNILYFSSSGRKIAVVTQQEAREFYGSLEKIFDTVKDRRFLSIHKSFLVNFKYIAKYQYDAVTMADGSVLPVSQSRRKAVRARFVELSEVASE